MIKINLKFIYLILLGIVTSCDGNIRNINCEFNYSIIINNEITVDKKKLEKALSSVLKQNTVSQYSLEIIVFGFSSGKEEYTYSQNDTEKITTKTYSGSIEVLLKIRYNDILKKAVFITSHGDTIKENVDNLTKKIYKELCE